MYSINGAHLGSKYVSGRVTGLTTANDYLVVADDAGDITMSRLYGYARQPMRIYIHSFNSSLSKLIAIPANAIQA